MRIVFVQVGLGAGGAEKVISVLAEHELAKGNEVYVLSFANSHKPSYFPYPQGVVLESPPSNAGADPRSKRRFWNYFWWLRRRIVVLRPDVVVSFLTKTNVLVLAATRGLKVPVVISERNNPLRQHANGIWPMLIRLLGRRARSIVMQTDAALAALPSELRGRATVIPNPAVIPAGLERSPGDGSRLVAVGRLERQKGFDLLIQAFHRARIARPGLTLSIFGEGPERSSLEQQIHRLGISDRVALLGVTGKPCAWVEHGDIFVLSSRFEGFPNVLIEALSAGFPSVAFDCPWGPSSIIVDGRNGILVPAEDVDAMAAGIVQLAGDAALRERYSLAARTSMDRFSPRVVFGQWDQVLTAATSADRSRD